MAGIGRAPCRSAAAEDVRDLKRWVATAAARYVGRAFSLAAM